MLILIAFICLLFIVGSCFITSTRDKFSLCLELYRNDCEEILMVIGGVGLAISILATIILGGLLSSALVVDERIKMYTEENEIIEYRINEAVTNYMTYEQETYSNFKVDDIVVAVSLYPELKSDELVKTQIETYVANNDKIKEYKNQKISAKVFKWWIYFGH